jgi:cell division protein FtsX
MTRRRYDLSAFLLVGMIGGLVGFALIYGLLNEIAIGFFDTAISEGTADRQQGASYIKSLWTFLPAIALSLAGIAIIQQAIFESRGGA